MKNLFIVIALCILTHSQAQVRTGGSYDFMMVINNENDTEKIVGSPYFLNDEYSMGIVSMNDMEPLKAFLRYNVAKEVIEIKLDGKDSEVFGIPSSNRVKYQMGDRTLLWESLKVDENMVTGYFVEYYDGNSVRLLGKPIATRTEAVKATTGYGADKPARIDIKEVYLLAFEDGRVEEVSLKPRDIKKAVNSDKINTYLKDNKVKTIDDLVNLLVFYDGSID